MTRILVLFVLLAGTLGVAGCNTIQGVGQDIKDGGAALDRAVTK